MQIVRDLAGGGRPSPIELFYNGEDDADATTLRYKGSLVKLADWNNANGIFCTHASESTAYENLIGILAEEQGTSDNYLANDASYGMRTKKIEPLLPTSIIRGEYAQTDPAGTSILDTSATATAASTTFTVTITTADLMIGGWIYFTNGSNANYLHYITDNSTTTATFATAVTYAVVAADDWICILPPNTLWMDFDSHDVNIVSEVDDGSRTVPVVGLMTYITDVGIPFQRLDRDKHDGLKLVKPRFYHDFVFAGSTTLNNVWTGTVIRA